MLPSSGTRCWHHGTCKGGKCHLSNHFAALQIPGLVASTAADGVHVFKPYNVAELPSRADAGFGLEGLDSRGGSPLQADSWALCLGRVVVLAIQSHPAGRCITFVVRACSEVRAAGELVSAGNSMIITCRSSWPSSGEQHWACRRSKAVNSIHKTVSSQPGAHQLCFEELRLLQNRQPFCE